MGSQEKSIKSSKLTWMGILITGLLILSTAYLVNAASLTQSAEEGKTLYEQNCIACHTIGGGTLVGPDLQGVISRRDQDWLINFISAPDQMLAEGDPIATQLLEEYNNVAMPNLGLSETQVESILAYLETQAEGAQEQPETAPLPEGDQTRGLNIFTGKQNLQNGGVPCMGCHNVGGIGRFGGGSLGPDLTQVHQRYGEAGLAAALQTITFPTMREVYANKPLTQQEQADLLAFFSWTDQEGKERGPGVFTSQFWTWGVAGMVLLFGVMAVFWPRQRKSLSERIRENGS